MTPEPRFLTLIEVVAMHQLAIARFGGASGVRDQAMLESALGRAQNRWHYEEASLARLAADYGFGIARNHPFVDGNKRTAFLTTYTFLGLNGYELRAEEANVVITFRRLAAGKVDEAELTAWIELHLFTAEA